ncbi:hypothetical protein BJV78DRAFT_1281833 [Lactifluus subvellereus]|nr:hypothetical protein BJV78DRAFT_1281833 [Lactifluus subvellereus]
MSTADVDPRISVATSHVSTSRSELTHETNVPQSGPGDALIGALRMFDNCNSDPKLRQTLCKLWVSLIIIVASRERIESQKAGIRLSGRRERRRKRDSHRALTPVETEVLAQGDAYHPAVDDPTINVTVTNHGDNPEQEPQTGQDLDDSTHVFWTFYGKEAKHYDDRKESLKKNMDSAGSFSAILTASIIESEPRRPNVAVPFVPPPPYPAFNPSASAVRVNVFRLVALVFSISAVLLAILVQQWVQHYFDISQAHSDPMKGARLRQYLLEGSGICPR